MSLQALAETHEVLGFPALAVVCVSVEEAAMPDDLAGKVGWARLAGRVVWTEMETAVPVSEVLAAEWVDGRRSFRLRFGPQGRTVVRIAEVSSGGREMLREAVKLMARGLGGKPQAPWLLYHVYWGLDESWAIDRRFDAFNGFAGEGP